MMIDNVISLPNDPFQELLAVAAEMDDSDLCTRTFLGQRLADAVVEVARRGTIPLYAVNVFAISGHDSGRVLSALRRRLDHMERVGLPALEAVAADYLRQLDVQAPHKHELTHFCRAIERLHADPEGDARDLHEGLHLAFLSCFSLLDHQGVETDLALATRVVAANLLHYLPRAEQEHIIQATLSVEGGEEVKEVLEILTQPGIDRALRPSFDALENAPVSDRDRRLVVTAALTADSVRMRQSGYLKDDAPVVMDPITAGVDLLTPHETREILFYAFDEKPAAVQAFPSI